MPIVGKGVKLELVNFEKLARALDASKFKNQFRKEVKRATLKNALTAASAIQLAITQDKVGDPNHILTKVLKGSDRPLVDTGDLLSSIHGKAVKWDLAFVGVLKSAVKTKVGATGIGRSVDVQDLALILHEGVDIKVTDKMRRFFSVMAGQFPGRVKPLKASTTVIHIPGRPFMEAAFDAAMIVTYQGNWEQAVDDTYRALLRR